MKPKLSLILFSALTLMITSCATKFDAYRQKTSYNLMQCQKMCSTGNIAQIQQFGCACNFNNRSGSNQNKNMNYSSSNGNTVYINSGAQNPAQNQFFMGIASQLMQHEERRLDRLNRDLNSPNPNVVPQNNTNIIMPSNYNQRQPASFGGFGGF